MERRWAGMNLRAVSGWQLRGKDSGGERRKRVEGGVIEVQRKGEDLDSMVGEVVADVRRREE